jgi:uncharacterized protein
MSTGEPFERAEPAGRELAETDFLSPRPTPDVGKPRIWPVFVTLLAVIVLILFFQILAGLGLAAWALSRGTPATEIGPEIMELLTTPWAFIVLGAGSQLAMLIPAVVAARLSSDSVTWRLGLDRPGLPALGFIAVAFGSWVPLAVSLGLVYSLPENLPTDSSAAAMYEKMTWAAALPFLLFISLAPGLCEEILFRGYVQRRLLERWSPWAAILVTSVIFALFHIMPHGIAVAFPLGIWLGWLAWKTGSVWPGVVCHAFVNGSWNVYQIGARLDVLPEEPPMAALVAVGGIAVAGFVASVYFVRTAAFSRTAALPAPSPEPALKPV